MAWKDDDPIPTSVGDLRDLLLELFDDPDMSRNVHLMDDLDSHLKALHHTLNPRLNKSNIPSIMNG